MDRPGYFVEPTIISGLEYNSPVVRRETFAPIVYVLKYDTLEEAIEWNNSVDQGLSSSIFTNDIGTVFKVCNLNEILFILTDNDFLLELTYCNITLILLN